MKGTDIIVKLLIIFSIVSMFVWVPFSKPYVVKPSPIVLLYEINPLYLPGFLAILTAFLLMLFSRYENKACSKISFSLLAALITAMYMQLPPLALFKYPFSDHSCHVTPIYWILRSHNINWPEYLGHPETVSPQLLVAIWMMVTNHYSVFTLHKECLIVLPMLTIMYACLLARSLGLSKVESSLTALLALGLSYFLYYFLRQTYTMPIYILMGYLLLRLVNERRYLLPLMIIAFAFISMDSAFTLLTVMAFLICPIIYFLRFTILRLKGVREETETQKIFVIVCMAMLLFGLYMLWIFDRYPYQPRDLYHIVQHMWNTVIKALYEPSVLIPKQQYYWGKPTALVYNEYYSILYDLKVFTRVACIALGALTTLLTLTCRKAENPAQIVRFSLISSYFIVTTIAIVTKGYGATFAPWTAVMCALLPKALQERRPTPLLLQKVITTLLIAFTILTILVTPNVTCSGGRIRLENTDLSVILWLSGYLEQQYSPITPGFGRWLGEAAYILKGKYITVGSYLFYEGLTSESINNLANYSFLLIPSSSLMHFETTNACYYALKMLVLLAHKLSFSHNLIYSSGYPFVTIWMRA